MRYRSSLSSNLAFVMVGLGSAVLVATLLSPFASPDPDGLNRVAEDLEFADRELEDAPASQLPFAQVFDGYALKRVPESIATPLAGLVGTLVTFGIAWGFGKLVVRNSNSPNSLPDSEA
jgi:cobalt/nickel transport protein